MPALSERDMRVLAFERGTWRTAGAKEQAIAEVLGITATRYYQLLNELIDTQEALRFDPTLVKRLRSQRARRQRIRSPKPPGACRRAERKANRPRPPAARASSPALSTAEPVRSPPVGPWPGCAGKAHASQACACLIGSERKQLTA